MDMVALLMSFCGGALGAAMGALGAFCFVGIAGLVGIVAVMTGANFDWLGLIPFGIYFGPHISFGGGVAAAAYARKMGYMPVGKDIVKPLISLKKPSVLIIGGIFGILAYIINYWLGLVIPGKIDTVAFTVFLSAIIAKVAFGNDGLGEILGKVPDEIKKIGGRYSVLSDRVWLPWQTTASENTIVGIAAGGCSAYITYMMMQNPATVSVAPFVGFFIGVTSFILMIAGLQIPVTHHIALGASYAVVSSGGSILWGIAGGIIGAFAGDLLAKTFWCYGDCHVDPPGMSISFTSFLFFTVVPALGLYSDKVITPLIIIIISLLYGVYQDSFVRRYKSTISA